MTSTTLVDVLALTATIAQEAGGEPFRGQLLVAHTIMNRAASASVPDVIFRALQFSCWNTDSPTRMRLDTVEPAVWRAAFAAAVGAYFRRELGLPDLTGGATHYLNPELTKKIRGGTLPDWAADPADPTRVDPAKVVAQEGLHTFLKLA